MKECPQCHAPNDDDAKVCASCGSSFKKSDSDFITMKDMKKPDMNDAESGFKAKLESKENDEWALKKEAEKEPDEWAVKKEAEKEPDEWAIKKEAEKEPDLFAEKKEQKNDDWSVPAASYQAPVSSGGTVYGDVVKPPKKGIPTWVWIVGGVLVLACICCVVVVAIAASNGAFDQLSY